MFGEAYARALRFPNPTNRPLVMEYSNLRVESKALGGGKFRAQVMCTRHLDNGKLEHNHTAWMGEDSHAVNLHRMATRALEDLMDCGYVRR